ncbi:Flowering time control protein FCA [Sesamum angolense]|uniref:Flowering time control protein FCA n=1 Tax=Sesamum angolense TaxID=2727404 RepID=A0AAE1X7Y4_9LAMI|nr:Flowering time control protein FCA [Sesamum angolense]
MDRHGGERRADHLATTSSFHTDGGHHYHEFRQDHLHGAHHYHQPDHRHHHNLSGEQNASTGYHLNGSSNHSLPLSGQKRLLSHPNGIDCGGFVKLYVVGIPREATEQDISAVFGEYGHILEVVLLKDKRTGLQQECCFVKYATIEQAERAIGAFHSQYTFPGAVIPIKVKYADGERERLGCNILRIEFPLDYLGSLTYIVAEIWSFGAHVHKLYVGCLNRQSSKWEIEEIFSPFGVIEEIFIVRDEFKQNRGCAFVQFSSRHMAAAAIQALHGKFVMRGCDQPLIVRFADPKKPRIGDTRPAPYLNDPSNGPMQSNEIQTFYFNCMSALLGLWENSTSLSCDEFFTFRMQVGNITSNGTTPVSHACDSVAEIEHTIECDWSEHVSPDGDLYYYNCVTCESKWEKPEEYALYEQELDNFEDQQQQLQESKLHVLSSLEKNCWNFVDSDVAKTVDFSIFSFVRAVKNSHAHLFKHEFSTVAVHRQLEQSFLVKLKP